jgi:uncharacterized protein YndB with AHSA1/START domain
MSRLSLVAEPGMKDLRMKRIIDAPRGDVYRAFVDPELITQWWTNTRVDKNDVRVGGEWRYVTKLDGKELGFKGLYKEIVPNWKLVTTFEYEPLPGHVMTQSITFSDTVDRKTVLEVHCEYDSAEDRDNMLNTGMEAGAEVGYVRMEAVLKKKP